MDKEKKETRATPSEIFGEIPDRVEPERELTETESITRGIIIATGSFIVLALLIVLVGSLPMEPNLPTFADTGEYETLLAEEEAILTSYGWADEDEGVVRMPVKDAMKILADEGLPARDLSAEEEESTADDEEADADEEEAEEADADEEEAEEADADEEADAADAEDN
jgi:hypothetical protein